MLLQLHYHLPVQAVLHNAFDVSWQLTGVPDEYRSFGPSLPADLASVSMHAPSHRPYTCCHTHTYGSNSASVRLSHTPVPQRGTHCPRTSVPHQTLQFLEDSYIQGAAKKRTTTKLRFLKNRSVNLHVIFIHCKERICTYLDNM